MTREIEAKDRETDGEMMIFYDEPTEDYGSGKNISSDLMHNEDGNTISIFEIQDDNQTDGLLTRPKKREEKAVLW